MTGLHREVRRFSDLGTLSHAAAKLVLEVVTACVDEGRGAAVVLAGGSTPRTLYETLAAEPCRDLLPWRDIHLFWGDERYVPADSPLSNYRLARRYLIGNVPIPDANIHAIPTSFLVPADAAGAYERELRGFFPGEVTAPPFDLTILGFGADGHTASLFPGDPVLHEQSHWVAAVTAPPGVPPESRITLTLPALNGSRTVLVAGARPGKETVVTSLEQGGGHDPGVPVLMLSPRQALHCYIADTP